MNPMNYLCRTMNNLKVSKCTNSNIWNYFFNYPQYEKKVLESIFNRWEVDNNKANLDLQEIITNMRLYANKTWKIVNYNNIE